MKTDHQELPSAMLESVGYHKGYKAAKAHAEALAEALRGLLAEVKLGKLNIRKDFSLINHHAQATKTLRAYETAK